MDNCYISLGEEGHHVTKSGVYYFLKNFQETGTIARRPDTGSAVKVNPQVKKLLI